MRSNEPQYIDYQGNQYWQDEFGSLHRDDGPAIIYTSGTKVWYKHGFSHREDGPARTYCDKAGLPKEEYWFNGKKFASEKEFLQFKKLIAFT